VTISLLVPTRQRRAGIERFFDSAFGLAERPDDLELVVYIDDDDDTYAEVDWPTNTTVVHGPRITLSEMWNRCYDACTGDICGHMGDDIVFRTVGWDRLVRLAFADHTDHIAFVHGRDGIQDHLLGTHGFLHRRWVETVGYFVPPYFSSDFNDTWLTEVADAIGRRVYLPDLYTEHMHVIAGKAKLDQNTLDRLERHQADNVAGLYANLAPQRAGDASKLLAVMS
jgi:hypothetical protein